jgi:hypothetical protein
MGGGGMGMGGRQMAAGMMERMPMNPGMKPPGAGGPLPMPGAGGGPRIPMDPALPMKMMGAGPFPHGDLDLRGLGGGAPPTDAIRPYRPLSGRNFYFLAHLASRAAAAAPVQPAMPIAQNAPPAAPPPPAPLAPVAQGMAPPLNAAVPVGGDGVAKKG